MPLLSPPPHALPALTVRDRIALLLIELHYTFASRTEIIAHAERHGSVWCCEAFGPDDLQDQADVEALLPESDEWDEEFFDWYTYDTTTEV